MYVLPPPAQLQHYSNLIHARGYAPFSGGNAVFYTFRYTGLLRKLVRSFSMLLLKNATTYFSFSPRKCKRLISLILVASTLA